MSDPGPRRRLAAILGGRGASLWASGGRARGVARLRPVRARRCRRRTALIGAGVTLLVAVGGVFGWNLWQGRSADQDLLLALPQPVSETPTQAWSWQAGSQVQAVYAVGGVTLVEQDFDTLTALDAEGEELWTSSIGPDAFVMSAPGRDDVFVEASFDRIALRSLEDGAELWASEGRLGADRLRSGCCSTTTTGSARSTS